MKNKNKIIITIFSIIIIVSIYFLIFQITSKLYPFWISNEEVRNKIDKKYSAYFDNEYMHFSYDGFSRISGSNWYENSADWFNIGAIAYGPIFIEYHFKYNYDTHEFIIN